MLVYKDGEVEEIITYKKRQLLDFVECDLCKKKIVPVPYRDKKGSYVKVHTWHNDWCNDSIDSHDTKILCKECACKYIQEYIMSASGSEELELEHKCAWDKHSRLIETDSEYDNRDTE